MIDHATIERILDAADIVEVVQDFVPLKKRGVNHLGLCPFHNEKTPSFTVSQAKGIYKCFGCGKAGNAVNFIMEHERLTYPEALKYLAAKYHIEVVDKELSPEDTAKQNERESLLVLSAFATRQFSENLFSSDEGQSIGLSYFKERGFRQETLKKFEVGYSFNRHDAFSQKAMESGYNRDYLITTGLSIEHENSLYDRFRGRVMFPIHSLSGQVLGFGGRVLKTDAKTAKYLNSPESEIYHKSRILYGIYQARKAIGQFEKCYLVEGYTDVMSLHEAGIENVVASSGTSLTQEQVRLIKRFTPNVTILYDGDYAGIKASLRGIDIVLEEGLNVKIVLLPEGEDPDSYSKKISNEEFKTFLHDNETDFIKFKTKLLLKDTANDPIEKANVISDIVKSISVIPEAIPRTIYIKECSVLMGVPENVLYQEVNKIRQNKYSPGNSNAYRPTTLSTQPSTQPKIKDFDAPEIISASEREIIRILIRYGSRAYKTNINPENNNEEVVTISDFIVNEITSDELSFENDIFSKVFEEFKFAVEHGTPVDETFFLRHANPSISQLAADMLSRQHIISNIWKKRNAYVEDEEMKLTSLVDESILIFKGEKLTNKIKEIRVELEKAVRDGNKERILELQRKDIELKRVKCLIAKNVGDRIVL